MITLLCHWITIGRKMTYKSFCNLTVVIYEDINCAACYKVNMQSHILKNDIYSATTAVLSASDFFIFFKSALSCLSSHPWYAFHVLIPFVPSFWSNSINNNCAQLLFNDSDRLSLATMIIWLSCATVTVEPPKHSNQERPVLLLSLLCFCHNARAQLSLSSTQPFSQSKKYVVD